MSKRILRGVLFGAFPVVLLWVLLASTGRADDFICENRDGCVATMPGPDEPPMWPWRVRKGIKFTTAKKFGIGTILSTSQGWVGMDKPGSGWVKLEEGDVLPYLPAGYEPIEIMTGS